MNDAAHCLKCQAVLRTRGGVNESGPGLSDRSALQMDTKRQAGEASTYKYDPGSAMESKSGRCDASPDGMHNWKFGKCAYCQKSEGQLAKGSGVMANPGGATGECARGGKCMYKFAKCTKCGMGEGGIAGGGAGGRRAPPPSAPASAPSAKPVFAPGEVGRATAAPREVARDAGGYGGGGGRQPGTGPTCRDQAPAAAPKAGGYSAQPAPAAPYKAQDAPMAQGGRAAGGGDEERVKMECFSCGYKSVPQWMNNEAHCLKCDVILRKRENCQGEGGNWSANPATLRPGAADTGHRRQAGEASTYKQSPSSAMESKSGQCDESPDGVHNWKFGKCTFCQKGEGKLAKAPGAMANPGGSGGCGAGGKCIYKFSKCSKCGKREF